MGDTRDCSVGDIIRERTPHIQYVIIMIVVVIIIIVIMCARVRVWIDSGGYVYAQPFAH